MTDDWPGVPDEAAAIWTALEEVAPEPLPDIASYRMARALAAATAAISGRRRFVAGSRALLAGSIAVAVAVGALAGSGIQARNAAPSTPALEGPQYLLLLHDNEAVNRAVQEHGLDAIVGRYAAWARGLAEEGRLVVAEKLTLTPTWVGSDGRQQSSIGGFFLIRAANLDEALGVAQGSPHAEFGGVVELREIDAGGPVSAP
jgi:hypothetical protein